MHSRVALLSCLAAACSTPAPAPEPGVEGRPPSSKVRISALRERESARRGRFNPALAPPWVDASGSDPYRIAAAPDGFLGLLRGSRAVSRLDGELRERERVALPITPTALCGSDTGEAWVGSRYDRQLLAVRFGPQATLRTVAHFDSGVADVACGPAGLVYVASLDGSELLTLETSGHVRARRPAMAGDLRLVRRGHYLLEASLFERSVRVLALDERGVPAREVGRVRHDGTLWALDAVERAGELLIGVAGVEDRPLVRAHGEFENIDSFAWLYRLRGGAMEQLGALNLSDQGVVVPKAVGLAEGAGGVSLSVLGAGSGRWLEATWDPSFGGEPRIETRPAPPGAADAVFETGGHVVYASPLLDAFIALDASGARITRVDPATRPEPEVRLGEALFFTELMAPENSSAGTHSRFTCETCHFEGGVDGRTHYTGRADVSVVTKPLFGLANNRPHFSRAMDPDLSSVSHNEFRVAGAGSGTDPWFRLEAARFPWLGELGIARGELEPLELRAALLEFLYAFTHAPNPASSGRSRFSEHEAEGARAFRDSCQSCHEARLAADDPTSIVPFAQWEARIFSRNAPIVWARGEHAKTGILPYVHERGTRIPSLRRLGLKPRYFTNGSAPDLASVLERFRLLPGSSMHEAPSGAALPAGTRAALLAFLRLL